MKIAILGYSGSGKSTLAKRLGDRYHLPVLYLDTVQFVEDWKERDRDEALTIVSDFMKQESWVIDGNYAFFQQKERLQQADCIIYMGFSRMSCLFRVLKRYVQNRGTCRESMAKGCTEKIDMDFVWWVLYAGRTKQMRTHNREIIEAHKEKIVVIKNQKQLDEFLRSPL